MPSNPSSSASLYCCAASGWMMICISTAPVNRWPITVQGPSPNLPSTQRKWTSAAVPHHQRPTGRDRVPQGGDTRSAQTRSKLFGSSPEKLTIVIEGQGDPDFSKALDSIFASHLYASPSLPELWQPFARKHFLRPGQCQPHHLSGKSAVMHVGANVKAPRSAQADPA